MTVTNKKIADGFAAAKKYLWDGFSSQTPVYMPIHICTAIDKAASKRKITVKTRDACQKVITSRLDNSLTFTRWLKRKGVTITKADEPKVQAHRQAWLDLLIKEFSQ